MQFSAGFLAAALPLLTAAAPAPAASSAPIASSGPIGLIAIHPDSPIHLSSVNAAGQNFYIGKDTSSYCPLTPPLSCPPGKSTVISVFGDQAHPGTAAMAELSLQSEFPPPPFPNLDRSAITRSLTPFRRFRSRRSTSIHPTQRCTRLYSGSLRLHPTPRHHDRLHLHPASQRRSIRYL